MKSSVEQINPVQYRISIEVTGEEVDKAYAQVLRGIQKKAKLQGFRPGKAPMDLIKKIYSDHASFEVRKNLIQTHTSGALSGSTLRTVAAPVIERADDAVSGQAFTFVVVVDTMPEIKLSGYKGMEVTVEELEYSESMLERELNNLRQRGGKASPLPTEGAKAEPGMLATIGHQVSKDGEVMPHFDVKEYAVLLGNGQLLPGLEELIIGLGVGESKSGKVTIPADFNDPDLANQVLDITVELKDLKGFEMPGLDDDLAKDNGFESLDSLKSQLQKQLEAFIAQTNEKATETGIVNKLSSLTTIEAPPAIVDSFVDNMINEEFQNNPKAQDLLKNEELRKQFRPKAREKVIRIMLLLHVFNEEKMQVSDEEISVGVEKILQQHKLSPQERKNIAAIKANLKQSVRENTMIAKSLKWLHDNAQISKVLKKA